MSALENYRSTYGEYPAPVNPNMQTVIDGKIYDVAGALVLYQVLSGDGNDKILTKDRKAHHPSDGIVSDLERKRAELKKLPPEMIRLTSVGYLLVDAFGHPFQYSLAGPTTINVNYDLWSFAQSSPPLLLSKDVKQSDITACQWIRNW